MGIQNFPAALQPIIMQGFLEREFEMSLKSRLGYRLIADREEFSVGIGETLTKTRAGLKPSVTVPLVAASNTNLDNGLTSTNWGVEQYTITLNFYAATQDLNMVTSRVGIATQFLQNAATNGEQAARSLDELARNALFAPYFGGNTRVIATLGSAGPSVEVDDIRGFQTVFINGVQQNVSTTYPLTVTLGFNSYSLVGVTPDAANVSTAPNGVSGALLFSANVTVADGTISNAVKAATASSIVRPASRGTTAALQATDTLTMGNLLDAVALLRRNAVPLVDGVYNCYLDPVSARQLFADSDFKQLFQGATSSNPVFRQGMVSDFLGLRFITTTEAYVQNHPNIAGLYVRRPIVCGQGALIEGDFAGMAADDVAPKDSLVNIIDNVAMVTREPIDRLQQIIAQSWYWIGGFCAPSDTTTTPTTVPTATNANYKRAVMIEHITGNTAVSSAITVAAQASVAFTINNPGGSYTHGLGVIPLNGSITPAQAIPTQVAVSISNTVAPSSGWQAASGIYANTLWAVYYPTPAMAGNYYVWVETNTGAAQIVSSFTIAVG